MSEQDRKKSSTTWMPPSSRTKTEVDRRQVTLLKEAADKIAKEKAQTEEAKQQREKKERQVQERERNG